MAIEVKIRKGEPVERALRRLKKKLDREGVIKDVRGNRYFEKPSATKRRAAAAPMPLLAPVMMAILLSNRDMFTSLE